MGKQNLHGKFKFAQVLLQIGGNFCKKLILMVVGKNKWGEHFWTKIYP